MIGNYPEHQRIVEYGADLFCRSSPHRKRRTTQENPPMAGSSCADPS
jgi:hypothetical protein